MNRIYILLICLCYSQVLSAQESETKSIIEQNEFFKKLQSAINIKSEIKTNQMLADARARYPDAVLTWYLSAKNATYLKDYMSAYDYYLRAKEVSDDADIDYVGIEILRELGEYEQLILTYQQVLEAHPYDASTRSDYLQLLFQLQKYDDYAVAVDHMLQMPLVRVHKKTVHFKRVQQLIKSGKVSKYSKTDWELKRNLI